jgi:hypothetical protein
MRAILAEAGIGELARIGVTTGEEGFHCTPNDLSSRVVTSAQELRTAARRHSATLPVVGDGREQRFAEARTGAPGCLAGEVSHCSLIARTAAPRSR